MRKPAILTAALALAVACGAFVPTTGTWGLSGAELASDNCDLFSDFDPADAEDSEVVVGFDEESGALTITIDTDGAFDCTIDGKDYTCTDIVETDDSNGVTQTMTMSLSGTFTDESNASMSYSITYDCTGDACAEAGYDFPCTANITGTLAAAAQ